MKPSTRSKLTNIQSAADVVRAWPSLTDIELKNLQVRWPKITGVCESANDSFISDDGTTFLVSQTFYEKHASKFLEALGPSINQFRFEPKINTKESRIRPGSSAPTNRQYADLLKFIFRSSEISGEFVNHDEKSLIVAALERLSPNDFVKLVLEVFPSFDSKSGWFIWGQSTKEQQIALADLIFGKNFNEYREIMAPFIFNTAGFKNALLEAKKDLKDYNFYGKFPERSIIDALPIFKVDNSVRSTFIVETALTKYKRIDIPTAESCLIEWAKFESDGTINGPILALLTHMKRFNSAQELATEILDDEQGILFANTVGRAMQKVGIWALSFLPCGNQLALPEIPESTILAAEKIYKDGVPFDVHEEKLNVLRGKPLESVLGNKRAAESFELIDAMENKFALNSPLKTDFAYVYRGFRVKDLKSIALDFKSVTFAGIHFKKALDYAQYEGRYTNPANRYSVIFAIKLPKGTPIIRTAHKNEILLPRTSEVLFDTTRETCSILDKKYKIDEQVKKNVRAYIYNNMKKLSWESDAVLQSAVDKRAKIFLKDMRETESRVRVIFCTLVNSKRRRIATLREDN
jgi:hypothetical protein